LTFFVFDLFILLLLAVSSSPPPSIPATPSIPTISLASLATASPSHIASLAASLDEAFSTAGFVILTNVTVTSSSDSLVAAAREFFGRDHGEKMRHNYGEYGCEEGGFTPVGKEAVSKTVGGEEDGTVERTGKDMVENYVFRTMHGDDRDADSHPERLYGEAKGYFGAMEDLLRELNRLMAIAMSVEVDFFNDFFWPAAGAGARNGRNGNSLRIAHYPARGREGEGDACGAEGECGGEEGSVQERSVRYGAHTDYQTFTILLQDPTDHRNGFGGLEVFAGGSWIPVVPPAPETVVAGTHTFVVNCGDLTEVWTAGRWKSVLHRVANPTSEGGWNHERVSVPFFTGPMEDVWVEPVGRGREEGEGGGRGRRYEAVNAKEHLMRKLGLSTA